MPKNKDRIDLDGWDLHRAAKENRVDVTHAMIARGDNVNAPDKRGFIPLHVAAYEGDYVEIARLLIKAGADVVEA